MKGIFLVEVSLQEETRGVTEQPRGGHQGQPE